ncbi:MAG: hypothetical protein FE78DRAFT_518584 [Acidomyces sp. 'richmondensis']|nr:MAG: hypothetical protein FE78DRAFT_518584 [Acidomyces sp. 'richmondensis']
MISLLFIFIFFLQEYCIEEMGDEYRFICKTSSAAPAFNPNRKVTLEPSTVSVNPNLQPNRSPASASAPPIIFTTADRRTLYQARKKLPCPQHCRDANGEPRLFAGRHHLQQHIRERHTQERPYKCPVCGPGHRGFNRAWTLNRHLGTIHGQHVGPGKGKTTRNRVQVGGFPGVAQHQAAVNNLDWNAQGNHLAVSSQVTQLDSDVPCQYQFIAAGQSPTNINLYGEQPISKEYLAVNPAFGNIASSEPISPEQPETTELGEKLDQYANLDIAAEAAMSMDDLFGQDPILTSYSPSSSDQSRAWDDVLGFNSIVCDIGRSSDFELVSMPEKQGDTEGLSSYGDPYAMLNGWYNNTGR